MPKNQYPKTEIRILPNQGFETECLKCGETIIGERGEGMPIYVGENPDGTTEVFGIFCANCDRKNKKMIWTPGYNPKD